MRTAANDATGNFRHIPSINRFLECEEGERLISCFPRAIVRDALRSRLSEIRQSFQQDNSYEIHPEQVLSDVRRILEERSQKGLQRVINATGIIIHTNLGRAPLAQSAVEAVSRVAAGYSNLEYDLRTGKRGGRGGLTEERLCRLTGGEAALVVNNNAAGVLLALSALADGGEVIVSRGELVEIGGSFRIPDVIRQGGARLVEVGSTNKTRVSDYAKAITEETRILLKVHASNFRIIGFTAEVQRETLSRLAQEKNLILIEDLGSGALVDLTRYGLPPEPTVAQVLGAGVHLAAFSGDKLLGGPQCGLLVGRSFLIRRIAAHPLFRALRADKMVLAALEATLALYEDPEQLAATLPIIRMLSQTPEMLAQRAEKLCSGLRALPGLSVTQNEGDSYSGGGTLPEERLPSQQVRVRSRMLRADLLAERLRRRSLPIIGRVADDSFIMDVRTVHDHEVNEIALAFEQAFQNDGTTDKIEN